MLDKYLNQTVTLKSVTATSEYGQPTRTTSSIKARKEQKQRLIRDKYGKEVISSTTVFLKECVSVDDMIDDMPVIDVRDMVDKGGRIVGREVFL